MRRYEGMFLFDGSAVTEWSAAEQEIDRLFERIGARRLVAVKYDERRLAYEIKKRKRGVYALIYFEADPQKIGDLERDARLSDVLLRILVLGAGDVTDERIAELKALSPDQPIAPLIIESRRHWDGRGEASERERANGERPYRRRRSESAEGGGDEDQRPHRRGRARHDEARGGAEAGGSGGGGGGGTGGGGGGGGGDSG